jgi:hypothetical protein
MWLIKHDELKHHGIKGQKWGVRRTDAQLSRDRSIASEGASISREAANAAGRIGRNSKPSKKTKNDINAMSDAELKAKINRMNLEQQYANLNPSRKAKGAEIAKATLETVGSVLAIAGSAIAIAQAIRGAKGG